MVLVVTCWVVVARPGAWRRIQRILPPRDFLSVAVAWIRVSGSMSGSVIVVGSWKRWRRLRCRSTSSWEMSPCRCEMPAATIIPMLTASPCRYVPYSVTASMACPMVCP